VTNFNAGEAWTTDERAEGAAPQGSGSILTGPLTSATALRAVGGTVTLGSYHLISIGVDTEGSCGLYATKYEDGGVTENASVYLCGNPADPDFYTVTGGTGAGVRVSDACVTIYNMMLQTKSATCAQVDSGVLNLGTGVTLHVLDSGTKTVRGMSADWAELHVINGNTDISAQGSFKNLTGYVGTTNDLTVTGTDNANAYNTTDYTADATILGGGAHDLMLGTGKVTAVLADGGTFASVKVTGTASVRQDVTVAGGLTVSNSDMGYALSATYADVKFAAGAAGPRICAASRRRIRMRTPWRLPSERKST
jgi:hypothetical protein